MRKYIPTSWPIRWQIAGLVLATQLIAHVVTGIAVDFYTAPRGGAKSDLAYSASDPMLTALRMGTTESASQMIDRFKDLAAQDDRFQILETLPLTTRSKEPVADNTVGDVIKAGVPPYWRDRVHLIDVAKSRFLPILPLGNFGVVAELPDNTWLVFQARSDTLAQTVPRAIALLGLLFVSLPLMFLSVWAGSALVAPIANLARSSERFAADIEAPELPESGPIEVRQANRAFNRMRQRIKKLIGDRSQTLASIGHDMRTPLTRLKLRLELLDDTENTTAMNDDVEVLERMIDDALAFLRSESRPVKAEPIDVAMLAKTVADDYADRGHAVAYSGPSRLSFRGDHDLLRRALDNIVGNAAKFAKDVRVHVAELTRGDIRIEVCDDGPGIPLSDREKVLEPFARIEAVRSGTAQQNQGFGLGLAIARDLIERHGGALELLDNVPRGLIVRFSLPSRAADLAGAPANG
jgi:signal transduction histidine kinase